MAKYIPEFFTEVLPNAWNATSNPEGVVNLGVAENKTCQETLQQRFRECKVDIPSELLGYFDVSGIPELRRAFASVLEKHVFQNGVEVDPDLLVISNGCTSTVSMLARILSDGVPLVDGGSRERGCGIPFSRLLGFGGPVTKRIMYVGPRYPGFRADLKGFSGVESAQVISDDPRRLPNEEELEAAYAQYEPGSIVAFLICNPDNPTGISWDKSELLLLSSWCRRRGMYIISDEIYGAGCWNRERRDGSWRPFFSLMEYADVTLWGLSKDFGSSGARCSVAYCPNRPLLEAMKTLNFLHGLGNISQVVLAQVLGDAPFVERYLEECREAMYECATMTLSALDRLGLPVIEPDAGMFVWVDFGEFGIPALELFRLLLREYKIFLTPGNEFFDGGVAAPGRRPGDVGWMRMCFGACGGKAGLQQGLSNLERFVTAQRASRKA